MGEGEWGMRRWFYLLLVYATLNVNCERRYGYYLTPDPPFVVGCFRGRIDTLSEARVSATPFIRSPVRGILSPRHIRITRQR